MPGRNIELKARLRSLAAAQAAARRLATGEGGVLHQTDTYFACSQGRLKLREFPDPPAQLIHYRRSDAAAARASDYEIVTVERPAEIKQLLSEALGVEAVVVKRRELWLCHNVRIHLDEVEGLGEFVELEAVLPPDGGAEEESLAHQRLAELRRELQIFDGDLLSVSYRDLRGKSIAERRADR